MRRFVQKKGLSFLLFLMLLMLIFGGISLYHLFHEIPISAMENALFADQEKGVAGQKTQNDSLSAGGLGWQDSNQTGEKGQDMDVQDDFWAGNAQRPNSRKLQKKCQRIYRQYTNLLVLVNKQRILSEDFDPELISISNGRLQVSSLLHSALEEMLADAGAVGYQYWLASAYRSRERQQQLIDEDVRALMQKGMDYQQAQQETWKETQPAGHSEHETGLALDILCSQNPCMDLTQEQEPGNLWLQENCWKYGFILRYPKEKEDITGISYEPWHFRYVGKKAAKFLYKHNLTLEEFYMQME